jgi:hypothetical protein
VKAQSHRPSSQTLRCTCCSTSMKHQDHNAGMRAASDKFTLSGAHSACGAAASATGDGRALSTTLVVTWHALQRPAMVVR